MDSHGVMKVTCPLGEYYRATHGKRVIAETLTHEEAAKMLDLYTLGYKDGLSDAATAVTAPTAPTTTVATTTVATTVTQEPLPRIQHALGLSNGILNLETLIVCPYSPSSPSMLRAGKVRPSLDSIPYIPWEDVSADIRVELTTFFEQVYPDAHLREYVFALLSACLFGNKKAPHILFFQGDGANGKSAIQILIESTFGEYYNHLTPSLLTRKTVSAETLAKQVGGSRIVHFGEPEGKIHGVFLKAVMEETDAVPIITCNVLPELACSDNSVWSRVRVIPHTTVFGSYSQNESRTVLPADMELKAKLLRWRIPLLSLLVHNLSSESTIPECVRIKTAEYRSRYDPYYKFVMTVFLEREGTIKVKDLRELIRAWKTRTNEDVKENEILEQIKTQFGERVL